MAVTRCWFVDIRTSVCTYQQGSTCKQEIKSRARYQQHQSIFKQL